MYISRLELSNYRRFESFSIDFDPQLTVVAARNGQGKTTVLEAIASAIGPFVGAFDEGRSEHIGSDDAHRKRTGRGSENELQYPVRVAATFEHGGQTLEVARVKTGKKNHRTTTKEAAPLARLGKQLQEQVRAGEAVDLPVAVYYSSQRLARSERASAARQQDILKKSRTAAYADSVSLTQTSFTHLAAWMKSVTYSHQQEFQQRLIAEANARARMGSEVDFTKAYVAYSSHLADLLRGVSTAVESCLNHAGWSNFRFNISEDDLTMFHEDHGDMAVSLLSDGVRAAIYLVADLAVRCARLNGHRGAEAVRETAGIVLIDEVDLHLHPAWQQRVLTNLREAFPKIQFIVTTHSPQTLSTLSRAHIREVFEEPNGVGHSRMPLGEIVGLKSSVALLEVMGVNPEPPVKEAALIHEYSALIEEGQHDTPRAKEVRAELERTYGNAHDVLSNADGLIRLREFQQRRAQRGL